MRQMISGLIAAVAVMTVSAAPAMACGGGLFQNYAEPCGQAQVYVSPAPAYGYSGCNTGCGGWAAERLPDPLHQYYYANQGPTYTGPGNFAPYPAYEEGAGYGYRTHRHFRHYGGYHSMRPSYHYGYAPRHPYGYGYGHREHVLRRYY
jgi:hypothetical protein